MGNEEAISSILSAVKEAANNIASSTTFNFNDGDERDRYMVSAKETFEEYKKEHGDYIVSDQNGNSYLLKDTQFVVKETKDGKLQAYIVPG